MARGLGYTEQRRTCLAQRLHALEACEIRAHVSDAALFSVLGFNAVDSPGPVAGGGRGCAGSRGRDAHHARLL